MCFDGIGLLILIEDSTVALPLGGGGGRGRGGHGTPHSRPHIETLKQLKQALPPPPPPLYYHRMVLISSFIVCWPFPWGGGGGGGGGGEGRATVESLIRQYLFSR